MILPQVQQRFVSLLDSFGRGLCHARDGKATTDLRLVFLCFFHLLPIQLPAGFGRPDGAGFFEGQ